MDFSGLKYRDLQQKCKEVGLSAKGKAQSLLDSLNNYFNLNEEALMEVDNVNVTAGSSPALIQVGNSFLKGTVLSPETISAANSDLLPAASRPESISPCNSFLTDDESLIENTASKLDGESCKEVTKGEAPLNVTPKFGKNKMDVSKNHERYYDNMESIAERKRRITQLHIWNEAQVPDTFKRLATPKKAESHDVGEIDGLIGVRSASVTTPASSRQIPGTRMASSSIPRGNGKAAHLGEKGFDFSTATTSHGKLTFNFSKTPVKKFVGVKGDDAVSLKNNLLTAKKAQSSKMQINDKKTIGHIDTRLMSDAEFLRYKATQAKIPLKERRLSLEKDDIVARRGTITKARSAKREVIVQSARK